MSLSMLAQFHERSIPVEQLVHQLKQPGDVLSLGDLAVAAQAWGFKCRVVTTSAERLLNTPLPAIAIARDGSYFLLAKASGSEVLCQDPAQTGPTVLSLQALAQLWDGQLLLLRSTASLTGTLAKFDLSWFIPAIVKHRRILAEVLVASFFLQLFALVTPLFFQVVMDKVLVNRGLSTLDVVATGLLGIMLFESLLSLLRNYIFAHTASRIDVTLGSRLFRHLVALPLAYFHARRVGDSVARVRELENIRSFLTSNAITLLLDVLFSLVFIAVMVFYSGWLTLLVVASLPLYFLISLLVTPLLRRRLQESFNRGAENQAYLVETINGIDTVKSMSVEPQFCRRWDEQLSGYVSAGLRTQNLSNAAGEGVSLIGKLVTVGTLWLGARLVVEGSLSVGQLIAFNMLAGRVAQPIMRLAQSWTNFQQTGVSIQRLGDILNTRTELEQRAGSALPPLRGTIEFQDVRFRYQPGGTEILRGVDLSIEAGQMVGVVGRSGSGKSTLTRLLQRLYSPESGRVLVDGVDIGHVDTVSLRRQVGVVLQENLLFNRSIRDNISLAEPGATFEQIVRSAELAGAHDFIMDLPNGYDSLVGEHGASLSGGQRQRIAIARALMGDPRILIFDEATSALDYESERVIQHNMRSIRAGRTVIVIAHRLSAVREADRIVVMDQGRIVESGSHAELAPLPDGHYAHLYRLQQARP